MDIESVTGFSLFNLSKKNVILGKNGCGKSYLLKQIEQGIRNQGTYGTVRYLSPERGGTLLYEPGIEQNISNDPNWMESTRRQNQAPSFRQQSATLFRRLEIRVLREIKRDHKKPSGYRGKDFVQTIEKLNSLLDRVQLERDDARAFKLIERETGNPAAHDQVSSGEAELISLGIEFLAFVKESIAGKENVLLVDEPDVHLHPDLQDKLARFVVDVLKDEPVTLILATHSTALLASLAEANDARVAFMKRKDTALTFRAISDVDKSILPIFGAHPLSNVFNQTPALLIEGEDDERMWQQAIRSSGGKIRVHPCPVDGIGNFKEYEKEVNNIIAAIYDDARAYSLRDRDLQPEIIADEGNIVRMRLSCRAAENLMLSNEALSKAGTSWAALQGMIQRWASANASHQYHAYVQSFIDGGFDRKAHDLKEIRNILIGLFSNKPWEVLVGQTIADIAKSGGSTSDGSIRDYLGAKVCTHVCGL